MAPALVPNSFWPRSSEADAVVEDAASRAGPVDQDPAEAPAPLEVVADQLGDGAARAVVEQLDLLVPPGPEAAPEQLGVDDGVLARPQVLLARVESALRSLGWRPPPPAPR